MYEIDGNQLHDLTVTGVGTDCEVWQQRASVPELLANLDMWASPSDHAVSVDGQPPLTVGHWLNNLQIVSQPIDMPMLINTEVTPNEK